MLEREPTQKESILFEVRNLSQKRMETEGSNVRDGANQLFLRRLHFMQALLQEDSRHAIHTLNLNSEHSDSLLRRIRSFQHFARSGQDLFKVKNKQKHIGL